MSQFFTSSSQNITASASTSVLPMTIPDWFLLGLTGWIALLSKELARVFSNPQLFSTQLSLWPSSHIHAWPLGKPRLWLDGPLPVKWRLCFSVCCLVCHSFPSQEQVSLNFTAVVTNCSDFRAQENEICHCSHCFPIYLPWRDGTRSHES